MAKKGFNIILFVLVVISAYPSSLNERRRSSINDTTSYSTGEIFATIRCKAMDENGGVVYNTDSSYFQGYFVVTNNNDSMLSFNLADFLDTSIQNQKAEGYTHLGERWGRSPVRIPFEFKYFFVDEKDSVYVHIMPWGEWADEWQYGNDVLDALRKRQAIILPKQSSVFIPDENNAARLNQTEESGSSVGQPYDLNGRPVTEDFRGIVIKRGKKILVK
ncbi:MAG: hypothetical protein ILP04_00070 [Bacteroidales bacterium]|nr:hypothetical protein [Bacteroidales bacterium]